MEARNGNFRVSRYRARVGCGWNNASGVSGVFALTVNNLLSNSNSNYGASPADRCGACAEARTHCDIPKGKINKEHKPRHPERQKCPRNSSLRTRLVVAA